MSLPIPSLPNSTGVFTITSPSFSVTLPNTMDTAEERRSFTNYIENVDALDGGIRTRPTSRNPIGLSISGIITSSSVARDVRRVLGEKSVTISRGGLSLSAEVSDFSLKEDVTNELWRFSSSFTSAAGYWSGGYTTTSADPSLVVNNGDIESFPRLIVTGGVGGATSVFVSFGSRDALYTGVIAEGETLVIDCFEGRVRLDGTNVLSSMNDDFFTNPPRLSPGSNSVTYSITGAASVVFYFEERYL